jgi:hypothetical protein
MTASPSRQSAQIWIARTISRGRYVVCHFIQEAIACGRMLLVCKIAFAVNGPQEKTRTLV